MSNVTRIPFTEIVERTQGEVIRDKAQNDSSEYKYKGAINEVYMTDFMLLLPEDNLRTEANITTIADYSEGLITVAAGGAAITGDGDADWTSANSNGGILKADGEDAAYRVAYSSATELTLSSPTTWVDDAVADGSYRLTFDRYTLASDFSNMMQDDYDDPEVVFWYSNGSRQFLRPKENGEFEKKAMHLYSTPNEYTVKWVNGTPYMYIFPQDDIARTLHYAYIPVLTPMAEYTTGTVTTTADPTVEGSDTIWNDTSNIDLSTYTYYFRVDADGTGSESKWYLISSITDADTLELSASYAGTARSATNYTISRISRWPARFDAAMIYGAALRTAPTDKEAVRWKSLYDSLLPAHRSLENKRIHGQRGGYRDPYRGRG